VGSLINAQSSSVGIVAGWIDLPREEVLAELDRVLDSHHFHTSKKCSRFLRHIVEAALDGHFDSLKERTLGVDVFDREPQYDTNQDPIVRGTAGEVRKRLAQYYLDAPASKLRFGLPPGSYIPEAHYAGTRKEQSPASLPAIDAAAEQRNSRKWLGIAATALAVCAVVTTSSWLFLRPTPLDRFWAPLENDNSVLVCMGQPRFYIFEPKTARVLNPWFADVQEGRPQSPPLAAVPLSEIVPMWDRSVSLADTQAFSRLVNLFARKRKQVDLRGERLISLADLRGRPSIFIGAFDNQWALSFAGDLRFYFDTDNQRHAQMIRDRQRPAQSDWKLVDAWPPGRDINRDYALVTRVVNRTTERPIVILGGISQYGTEAAAEFVTDPTYFERGLTHAPSDWYRKNIQIVLTTQVLSGVSGPPTVVAAYFW
jgi:hypothetical protein